MPKMLVLGSYTEAGIKQVMQQGGSARVAVVKKLLEATGARLVSMDFAFGSDDFVVIAEGPDNVAAATASILTASLGIARPRVIVLLSPEEVDAAAEKARQIAAAMQAAPQT
jgi:uncharacterized protein with GYD domain